MRAAALLLLVSTTAVAQPRGRSTITAPHDTTPVDVSTLSYQLVGDGTPLSRIPGVWKAMQVEVDRNGAPAPAAAQMMAMKAHVLAVNDAFRHMPRLDPPVGFSVLPHGRVTYTAPEYLLRGHAPIIGHYTTILIWHWIDQSNNQRMTDGSGEGLGFGVSLNGAGCMLHDAIAEDSIGSMYWQPDAPVVEGIRQTFTDRLGNRCIVLTRRTQPIWIPVSRERMLRVFAAQRDSSVENARNAMNLGAARDALRQSGASAAQLASIDSIIAAGNAQVKAIAAHRDALLHALAAMSPAERAAPTRLRHDYIAVLARLETDLFAPDGEPVVERNPAFFDATLPRGDVQAISLTFGCEDTQWCTDTWRALFKRIEAEAPYTELTALLK